MPGCFPPNDIIKKSFDKDRNFPYKKEALLMAKKHEHDFAVIGLGRFGANVAKRLEEMGHSVLGIEIDPQVAKEMESSITEVFVLDATNPDALAEADITSFKTVVVAISDDFENNALVTSTLKNMGIPNIICLAGSVRHKEILLRVGADRVVIPAKESGIQLADELSTPGMLNSLHLSPDFSLIEVKSPKGMVGKPARECEKYEVVLLLIIRGNELMLSPDGETPLLQEDILVVVGDKSRLTEFSALV
jgi:trk system potassium uptake protein TrkA